MFFANAGNVISLVASTRNVAVSWPQPGFTRTQWNRTVEYRDVYFYHKGRWHHAGWSQRKRLYKQAYGRHYDTNNYIVDAYVLKQLAEEVQGCSFTDLSRLYHLGRQQYDLMVQWGSYWGFREEAGQCAPR
jgi:hypothetical protein